MRLKNYILAGTLALSSTTSCKRVSDLMPDSGRQINASPIVDGGPLRPVVNTRDFAPVRPRTDASVARNVPAVRVTPYTCRQDVSLPSVLGNSSGAQLRTANSDPIVAVLCATPANIRNVGALRCRQTNIDIANGVADAGTSNLPAVNCGHPHQQNTRDNEYGRSVVDSLYGAISTDTPYSVGTLTPDQVSRNPLSIAFRGFLARLRGEGETVAPANPGEKVGIMERFINFMIGAPYTCESIVREVAAGFNRRGCCENGTRTVPCNTASDLGVYLPRSLGVAPSGDLSAFGGSNAFRYLATDFTILTRDGIRYFMPDQSVPMPDGTTRTESYYMQRGFMYETFSNSSCGTSTRPATGQPVQSRCEGGGTYCNPDNLVAAACTNPAYQRKDIFIVLDMMAVVSWRLRGDHLDSNQAPPGYNLFLRRSHGVAAEQLPDWYRYSVVEPR